MTEHPSHSDDDVNGRPAYAKMHMCLWVCLYVYLSAYMCLGLRDWTYTAVSAGSCVCVCVCVCCWEYISLGVPMWICMSVMREYVCSPGMQACA